MTRTRRDWVAIVGMLVGVPLMLAGPLVFVAVRLVDDVAAALPFDCEQIDHRLGEQMTSDPAVDELISLDPEAPVPEAACDEDDRTVSADLELQTGLSRDQAVDVAEGALARNGWRHTRSCFSKRINGRQVWATVNYRDEHRSDPASDLTLSMVDVREDAC